MNEVFFPSRNCKHVHEHVDHEIRISFALWVESIRRYAKLYVNDIAMSPQ